MGADVSKVAFCLEARRDLSLLDLCWRVVYLLIYVQAERMSL